MSSKIRYFVGGSSVSSNTDLIANQWQHITTTKQSDGTITHYLDGLQDGTGTLSGAYADTNTLIGGDDVETTYLFNGTIDSVAVYNRSLSAMEIRRHGDDRYTNSSGVMAGDQNRFFQYRVFMSTIDSNVTPRLNSIELEQDGYALTALNSPPEAVSLLGPTDDVWINTPTPELNWTDVADADYNYMNMTDSALITYLTFDSRDRNTTSVYDAVQDNNGFIGGGAECGNVTGRAGAGCRFNGSNVVVVSLDNI